MNVRLWAATAVIVPGYVAGFYFQRRDVESLRREMEARLRTVDQRLEDFKLWIQSEFRRIEERLEGVNKRIDELKERVRSAGGAWSWRITDAAGRRRKRNRARNTGGVYEAHPEVHAESGRA